MYVLPSLGHDAEELKMVKQKSQYPVLRCLINSENSGKFRNYIMGLFTCFIIVHLCFFTGYLTWFACHLTSCFALVPRQYLVCTEDLRNTIHLATLMHCFWRIPVLRTRLHKGVYELQGGRVKVKTGLDERGI